MRFAPASCKRIRRYNRDPERTLTRTKFVPLSPNHQFGQQASQRKSIAEKSCQITKNCLTSNFLCYFFADGGKKLVDVGRHQSRNSGGGLIIFVNGIEKTLWKGKEYKLTTQTLCSIAKTLNLRYIVFLHSPYFFCQFTFAVFWALPYCATCNFCRTHSISLCYPRFRWWGLVLDLLDNLRPTVSSWGLGTSWFVLE